MSVSKNPLFEGPDKVPMVLVIRASILPTKREGYKGMALQGKQPLIVHVFQLHDLQLLFQRSSIKCTIINLKKPNTLQLMTSRETEIQNGEVRRAHCLKPAPTAGSHNAHAYSHQPSS